MKVKKIIVGGLALLCLATAVSLAACIDDGDGTHEHVISTEWTISYDGEKHFHKCIGCSSAADYARHDYGEPHINSESTCVTAGSATYTCATCGYTKDEALPLAAHSWGGWTVAEGDAPTQDTQGKAMRICTTSGCAVAAEAFVIPSLSSGTFITEVIKPATATADGITKYTYTEGEKSVTFNVTTKKLADTERK